MPVVDPRLPSGFRFGTVAAAYQVEGATTEDGRGDSIWERFVRRPGAIIDGSNADTAADSYHRFREDVELLRRLGVDGSGVEPRRALDVEDDVAGAEVVEVEVHRRTVPNHRPPASR